MSVHRGEFERIRQVLGEIDPEQPLTAREIYELLDEHGEAFDSSHQIATILGRQSDGAVEVIEEQPYRYRIRVL
ncbi:hypothetical protein [Halocatena halophila]|uniref:hypothetical protein n=1 Tax=Halocatena halophila TaxID=2814576 RepID=UPI002ED1D09C